MPSLSPKSVTILDGAVVLSRRSESAKWQARFKVDSRWIRITTKEKDVKEAKRAAEELYLDARYRVKHELPAQTKRFKDVAKLAIDRMQKAVAGGQGRRSIATTSKPSIITSSRTLGPITLTASITL